MQGEVAPAHTYYYPDYAINQGSEEEGMDFGRLGRLLWKRKLWLLVAVALGTVAGWAASRLVAPEYLAFTSVAVEDANTGRGGPIQTGEVLPSDGWNTVFQSRAVIGPVVENLGLQVRIHGGAENELFTSFRADDEVIAGEYAVAVGPGGAWSLTSAGESGVLERGERGTEIGSSRGFSWTPDLSSFEAGSEITFNVMTTQAAVGRILNGLTVRNRINSDIIAAELIWHDPYEAADILNATTVSFMNLADQLKTQKIREEVDLLENQRDITGSLLDNAEFALQAHRVEAITEPTEPIVGTTASGAVGTLGQVDPVFQTFAANKVRAEQLALEIEQISDLQNQLSGGQELNLLSMQMLPSSSTYPELQSAVSQLQSARLNRRTLLSTYTEEEPSVVAVTQQIQELERSIIPAALSRLSIEIGNQIEDLNRQIARQGDRLREIPQRTIQTARLQREVGQAASLHSSILSRLKEAELAEATSGPGITILNPAFPNPAPRGEKPGAVIALFGLLSLGLGVAGIIVIDRFDRRIHSPDQVTGSLGLPVLAVVPRLQAAPDPASPAAAIAVESFRGLRTQIAHVDGEVSGVMLVTSPAPREGKSMVSANLAISYATAGYKTLLLDGDTRRGRAQEMFNLDRSPGLTDYLMERSQLEEVCQDTTVENLTLIARGAPGGFNADLLEGSRMCGLLDQIREEYDVVVVDGPPLAAGADVLLLGSFVDKVVIVLRAGTTTEDLAKAKLEALGNVDLPIVGAVLNALPKSAPDYEYYVHYYYADAESA
jgi:capsular exopolysaccharide synthesis family protein